MVSVEVAMQFLLQTVYFFVLTRYVGLEAIGELAIVNSIILLINLVGDLGYSQLIVKKGGYSRSNYTKFIKHNRFIVVSMIILISSAYTGGRVQAIYYLFVLLSFTLPRISSYTMIMAKNNLHKTTASINVGVLVIHYSATFLLYKYTTEIVYAVIVSLAISSSLKLLAYNLFTTRIGFDSEHIDYKGEQRNYLLIRLLNWSSNGSINLFIGYLFGLEYLGIFDRLRRLSQLLSNLVGMVMDRTVFVRLSINPNDGDGRLKLAVIAVLGMLLLYLGLDNFLAEMFVDIFKLEWPVNLDTISLSFYLVIIMIAARYLDVIQKARSQFGMLYVRKGFSLLFFICFLLFSGDPEFVFMAYLVMFLMSAILSLLKFRK